MTYQSFGRGTLNVNLFQYSVLLIIITQVLLATQLSWIDNSFLVKETAEYIVFVGTFS